MSNANKKQCIVILILSFFIHTHAQDRTQDYNSSINNKTATFAKPSYWSFGLNTGASFSNRNHESNLFRGNSIATKMFGRYHSGNIGLGFSGGIIGGTISKSALNKFIAERKFQQMQITKSNALNAYLLFGPSFSFGNRVVINADIQTGLFINNPGAVTVAQPGATRLLYQFEGGTKNLFPGFSGNISFAYPLNNSTRFVISTDYLQTKSSINLYDPQRGIDVATEQQRNISLITVGLGITKSFGSKKHSSSEMANGRKHISNVKYEDIAVTADETIIATTQKHAINTKGTGGNNGRIITSLQNHTINTKGTAGNRMMNNESCGPVTQKITTPDGNTEEQTFACPADAAAYNEHINGRTTVPKQTQGSTFGEKVNAGLHAAGSALSQGASKQGGALPGANIISGAISIRNGNSSGIITNQNAISSVGSLAGGGAAAASYASTGLIINNTPGSQGVVANLYVRDAAKEKSTGNTEYQKVYAEDNANAKNNPLYQGNTHVGNNPMYESKRTNSLNGVGNAGDKYEQQADAVRRSETGLCGLTNHFFVLLEDVDNGQTVASTRADSCGNFWFANIADGRYSVVIKGALPVKKSYDVTLPANKKYDVAGEILSGDAHWVVTLNAGRKKINNSADNNSTAFESFTANVPVSAGGESNKAGEVSPLYNSNSAEEHNPLYNPSSLVRGQPIRGVIVKGGRNPGGNLIIAQTNEHGEFEFLKLKSGNYTITAQVNYFIDDETMITFSGTDNAQFRKGWDGTVKGGSVVNDAPQNKGINEAGITANERADTVNEAQRKGWDGTVKGGSRAQDHNSSRSNKTASVANNDAGAGTDNSIVNTTKSNTKDFLVSLNELDELLNEDKISSAAAINNTKENSSKLRNAINLKDNSVSKRAASVDNNFTVLLGSLNILGSRYTSISNVLKTKHDTAKNSVGNIR